MTPSDITITNRRLDPAEAEVWLQTPFPATGRIVGPRCHYASTVEVAYPLRPNPASSGGLRAFMPEPNLWDPITPFFYEAVLQPDTGGEKIRVRHGLRTAQIGSQGLRVNRKPFVLSGIARQELEDTDAGQLRLAGINTLLVPVSAATAPLWAKADSLGFFVLGTIGRDPEALSLARVLKVHPCCLGWLLDDVDLLEPETLQTIPGVEPLLGYHGTATPPSWAQFVAGPTPRDDRPWLRLDDAETTDVTAPLGIIRI